jgi:hypothetical protein
MPLPGTASKNVGIQAFLPANGHTWEGRREHWGNTDCQERH